MGKNFDFLYLFEEIQAHESFYAKRMFGGLALYFKYRQVAVLMESPNDTKFKNKDYKEDIWYGILIPTNKEHHSFLASKIKGYKPHPFLKKWGFISGHNPNFEESVEELILLIKKQDFRVGIDPKI